MKQFTYIPINHGSFKEKTETSSNFTVVVFLQYVISSLIHQKVWFSQKILTEINSVLTYRKISESESLLSFSNPATGSVTCHTIYPRTPIDTPRSRFTPQDGLYMVRK